MDIGYIEEPHVDKLLHSMRQAAGADSNPIMESALVAARLRDSGTAASPQGREWALFSIVREVVSAELDHCRAKGGTGPRPQAERGQPSPQTGTQSTPSPPAATDPVTRVAATPPWAGLAAAEGRARTLIGPRETDLLTADFLADDPDREGWSTVYYRFVHSPALQVQDLARLVHRGSAYSRKYITIRTQRGVRLLTQALRDLESQANASAAPAPPAAALGAPAPPPAAVTAPMGPGRDDPRDIAAYFASRVAMWSQPRYQLDQLFVPMTLLVDMGEETPSGRWVARPQRFATLAEVLEHVPEPAVVLLGQPGQGKTTHLRHLELTLAQPVPGSDARSVPPDARPDPPDARPVPPDTRPDPPDARPDPPHARPVPPHARPIPFYVPLNAFHSDLPGAPPPSPWEWLAGRWSARYPALPPLDHWLRSGRLVLLLDALNEMPHADDAAYWDLVTLWKQLLQDHLAPWVGSRAVFACRSLDYSAPLSSRSLRVPQVRLEPLADDQIRAYLERRRPEIAQRVWHDLEGSPELALLRTPYFLTLFVDQVDGDHTTPKPAPALMTDFLREGLRRELEADNPLFRPGRVLTARDCRRLVQVTDWAGAYDLPDEGELARGLGRMAHAMQRQGVGPTGAQVRIPFRDALRLIDRPEAPDLLAAGAALGVIEEDLNSEDIVFCHQLQQEYFAARELASTADAALVRTAWRAGEVRPSVAETVAALGAGEPLPPLAGTSWDETTLMAVAMCRDAEAFTRALMDTNVVVAARAASAPAVRPRLSGALLAEIGWALARRSRDRAADLRARIAAARVLGGLGDPRFERREGPFGAYLMPPLVAVAGGKYRVGDDSQTYEVTGDFVNRSIPAKSIRIRPFEIAVFPVTNAEYARFIAAGGYEEERWWAGKYARRWRQGADTRLGQKLWTRIWVQVYRDDPLQLEQFRAASGSEENYQLFRQLLALDDRGVDECLTRINPTARFTEPRFWQDDDWNHPEHPVLGVSWYEAAAYCAWLAAQTGWPVRLPSADEWEAAARGPAGRLFAYGDVYDPLALNASDAHLRGTGPVGVFVDGDTPEGIADMGGNVIEWSSTRGTEWWAIYRRYARPGEAGAAMPRVACGAAWDYIAELALPARRNGRCPDQRLYNLGFRVAVGSPS